MGEYRRPLGEKDRIQADFAYRLGLIAVQYRKLRLSEDDDLSATLDICILQSLLTQWKEVIVPLPESESRRKFFIADIGGFAEWGFCKEQIEVNTYSEELTAEFVLERLRNALSHPTTLNLDDEFPSTGYTTIRHPSGKIRQFCFVNSPHVQSRSSDRQPTFGSQAKAEKAQRAKGVPTDVQIHKNEAGKYFLMRNSKPFALMFRMILTIEDIRKLVINLSNYLAQPIQQNWDGVTIKDLLAA